MNFCLLADGAGLRCSAILRFFASADDKRDMDWTITGGKWAETPHTGNRAVVWITWTSCFRLARGTVHVIYHQHDQHMFVSVPRSARLRALLSKWRTNNSSEV